MNPFNSDTIGVIGSRVLAAEKAKAMATSWYTRVEAAKAEVTAAEERFAETLADADAIALAEGKTRLTNLTAAVVALEATDGPQGAFDRTINTQQVFSLLARVFDERGAELVRRLAPHRKSLGQRLAQLVEEGASLVQVETDDQIRQLRATVRNAETAIQAAVEARNYCRQWVPGLTDRKVSDLIGAASADLPV